MGLLCVDGQRTREYVDALEQLGYHFESAIVLDAKGLGSDQAKYGGQSLLGRLESMGTSVSELQTGDVNDPLVVLALSTILPSHILYSGPPGAILRSEMLGAGKFFIHVHPGRLPDFRGSTTIYYQIIADRSVSCTAMILDEGVDTGLVIRTDSYPVPTLRDVLDGGYDSRLRARTFGRVAEELFSAGGLGLIAQPSAGDPFYVIHPVLKHVAIQRCLKD